MLKIWSERRRALRELGASGKKDNGAFSNYFDEQIELADNAFNVGAHDHAYELWRKMHTMYPDLTLTSKRALNLVVALGRYDEAEALLREGRRRYPRYGVVYAGVSAYISHSRGDIEEALRRCKFSLRKFPNSAIGYTLAASCLTSLGRHDKAENLITLGASKILGDPQIMAAHARHAERRADWPQALLRWERVKTRTSNFLGPLGMAYSLRQLGRYAEAKHMATIASEQFPQIPWVYVELAAIATAEGDEGAVASWWEVARRQCPDFAMAYTAGSEIARRNGRESEADAILLTAVTRMRYDLTVHLEYACNAHRRKDWAIAIERWALVRERFPSCDEARKKEAVALAATGETTDVVTDKRLTAWKA